MLLKAFQKKNILSILQLYYIEWPRPPQPLRDATQKASGGKKLPPAMRKMVGKYLSPISKY